MRKQISKEAIELLSEHLRNREESVSCVIVCKSIRTGVDYTYKIFADTKRKTRIVGIAIEGMYQTFKGFYYIFDDNIKKINLTKDSHKGGAMILNLIYTNQIDKLLEVVELSHTGKCMKCNRTLTDLTSIEFGMGPTCRGGRTFNRED